MDKYMTIKERIEKEVTVLEMGSIGADVYIVRDTAEGRYLLKKDGVLSLRKGTLEKTDLRDIDPFVLLGETKYIICVMIDTPHIEVPLSVASHHELFTSQDAIIEAFLPEQQIEDARLHLEKTLNDNIREENIKTYQYLDYKLIPRRL